MLTQCIDFKRYIEENRETDLSDIAYTLQVGRKAFEYRKAFLCKNSLSATDQLAALQPETSCKVGKAPDVLFVFHDFVYAYQHMDIELGSAHPIITDEIERCAAIIQSFLAFDFRKDILQDPLGRKKIEVMQLAPLFAFTYQYAIGHFFTRMGVTPSCLLGEGVGEIVSACVSDILSLREAIVLILHLYCRDTYQIPQEELEAFSPKIPMIPSYSRAVEGWIPTEIALNRQYWLELDTQTKIGPENILATYFAKEKWKDMLMLGATGLDSTNCFQIFEKSEVLSSAAQVLHVLGMIWEKGVEIHWGEYHAPQKHRRISLPTYPFEREEYWIQGNPFAGELTKKTRSVTQKTDVADWFYVPRWELLPLQITAQSPVHRWLVFLNDHPFNQRFADALRENDNIVLVRSGTVRHRVDQDVYEINSQKEEDYLWLLAELEKSHFSVDKILHAFCMNSDSSVDALQHGFYSILFLVKSLSEKNVEKQIEINVLTQNGCCVTGSEALQPEYAMVTSVCLVASQEMPFIRCRHIDIDTLTPLEWKEINLIEQVTSELSAPISNPLVAYRNNARWVKNYAQIKVTDEQTLRIKEQGVYVLIGGLGGVGLVLSQTLAEKRATIVLVGRSPFPQKSEWEGWLKTNPSSDTTRKIVKLLQMEQKGAEVCILRADATDESQMMAMFEFVSNTYGGIDGVIYAPVAKDASLFKAINEVTVDDCRQQFNPKIYGLRVLEKVLGHRKLDFCLVMSSLSSILGGLGFVGYSAANAFMDSFAMRHNTHHPTRWITVNWESWDVETNQKAFGYEAEITTLMMTPAQGAAVFRRVLNTRNIGQLIISSGSLHARVEQWVQMAVLHDRLPSQRRGMELRPELASEYIAPQNDLEEQIADVWREYFHIDTIGIDDNLFELGATSLSVIQLDNTLRSKLNKNIPIVKLFAYPTIRTLAAYLSGALEENKAPGPERSQEVDKGRNSAKLRLELRKKQ